MRRVLQLTGLLATVIASAAVVVPPASADGIGGTDASCSGTHCTVSVTYTGTAAPPPGSATAVPTVPPDCWYEREGDPKQTLQMLHDNFYSVGHFSGAEAAILFGPLTDFEDAAKDPALKDASWYILQCPGLGFDDPKAIAYAGETVNFSQWGVHARIARLIEPGETVPPPLVDVETLRDAAYDSMTIPDPEVQRSPEIAGSAATLVNLDTWFWAAGGYRDTWDITASVGPVSATVVAKSDDWVITPPAGAGDSATCTHAQFTRAYSSGAALASGCQLAFERASVKNPDGFTVDVTARWNTTWTGNPAPTAPEALDPIFTPSSVQVPVEESQSVVTEVD